MAPLTRIYSWLPLYHDMGLIACFIMPMVCHIPVVMQSPLDWVMHPDSMLQIMSDYKCTLAWMPNFAFQFVPRRTPQSRWAQYDLSSMRALINCSEPVRANSMLEFQKAFGIKSEALQSSYAMAENVFAVTQTPVDRKGGPAQRFGRRPAISQRPPYCAGTGRDCGICLVHFFGAVAAAVRKFALFRIPARCRPMDMLAKF